MLKFIIIPFAATLIAWSAFAQLEVPSHLNFKKIRTAHFDVIYNTEQQDLGLLYADRLEKAHDNLAHYFSQLPERTVVIINDKMDFTNGYATRVPYPHIMAYPVLPGPEESLADTGDWAYELLSHEYTHVLNFEPAEGFMGGVRKVFGTVAAPNILLPSWWKEGLAVQMETRTSNRGRLRSAYQDAVIRALVAEDRWTKFSIAEANEALPSWPEGMRPYLLGSVMWSEMVKDKGDAVIDKLNQRHSARMPYFLNGAAQKELQCSYDSEYKRALAETQTLAQAQLEVLGKVKTTVFTEMNLKSMYASAPMISPDGHYLAAISVSQIGSRQIKIYKRNPNSNGFIDAEELKAAEDLKEVTPPTSVFDTPLTGSIQRLSWFSDSQHFVYDKVDATNRIERYADLYTYDIRTQKTERLTKSLRAREPSVSPDDQQVAFVKLSGGRTQLALIHLHKNLPAEILFSPGLQERISYPIFLNEKEILFSLRKTDGTETLQILKLGTKTPTAALTDYPDARFASIDRSAQAPALYFTSSKNGTHNIYRSSLDLKSVHPVTHTKTAFFSYSIDPQTKDIYATQMSAYGPKIVAVKSADMLSAQSELPKIQPLFADRYPAQPITTEEKKIPYEISDYSSGEYLLPRYWIPFFASSTASTGIVLEAMTSGFDPLKKHSYSLMGAWDTGINRGSIEGTYLNQQTSLPMLVSVFQRNSYLGTVDNKITDTGATFATLPDTFWLSRYSALQLGWQYFRREFDGDSSKRTGPYALLSYADYSRAGTQISPESGLGGYLGAYNYISQPGYLEHSQFTAGEVTYLSKFLPDRHALMLKVNGVYTPTKIPAIYGVQTDAYSLASDFLAPSYLLRGYKIGQLLGRNMLSSNIEYRFPLRNIYRGPGTNPVYFHRLTGAVVADMASTDGYFINDKRGVYEPVSLQKVYSSYGVEVKLETTLGFVLPVSFVVGCYYAPNAAEGGATSLATNLLIGGY